MTGVINPLLKSASDAELPSLMLWNPYMTHHNIFPIKCTHCGECMYHSYWNDGSSPTKQPRALHGMNDVVLLISAVYSCNNRHRILAHDELVLDLLPESSIPFCLLHQTGFTKDLVDTCTTFCRQGVNFYTMETLILERRWQTFSRKQELLSNKDEFWASSMSKSPSNDILVKCFLAGFLRNENTYLHEMTSIEIGKSISFDHTFKIASNIGYIREDKRWINEYDSVLLIMNNKGKVVSWQLTKGTSMLQVDKLFADLAQRAKDTLETVYVDDCCKLRNKIQETFGKNVSVKLDLFHAIQRITKTFSKKHPSFYSCIQDLRLVFRMKGDSEEKRLSSTPCTNEIYQNFANFVDKWKDTENGGIKLFKPETLKAVQNLKKHISNGCLSNIPPSGGTNRNERLHEHIANYFNRSRIGILLAYALLHMIIHAHNTSMLIKGKRVTSPIEASPIIPDNVITATNTFIGIVKKSLAVEECNSQDHWEIDTSHNSFDFEAIGKIYKNAVNKFKVHQCLLKENLVRMSSDIHNFEQYIPYDNKFMGSDSSSNELLSNYGLTIALTKPDGNCFFEAIAINISQNGRLNNIRDNYPSNINEMMKNLRLNFVNETLGINKQLYTNFIPSDDEVDFEAEAKKFLENGYFNSSLGDLMPLAMATALNLFIFIIPSNLYDSPLFVNPLCRQPQGVIFMIYNPAGSGHYDAALPYSSTINSNKVESTTRKEISICCSCGVNKKDDAKSCAPNTTYATRCKCYGQCKSCGSSCRCKNCSNPYGVKPSKSVGVKRQRRPHSMQIALPNSKKFAEDRGEQLSTGVWSNFESIVLKEVIETSKIHESSTLELYNDIVYYANSKFCTEPVDEKTVLRTKTSAQIKGKLSCEGFTSDHK